MTSWPELKTELNKMILSDVHSDEVTNQMFIQMCWLVTGYITDLQDALMPTKLLLILGISVRSYRI